MAPRRYKRSIVKSFIHRVYNACSNWANFHVSLEKAKTILENNQYPKSFYEPIIHGTLERIVLKEIGKDKMSWEETIAGKKLFFIQYRGFETSKYISKLIEVGAPIVPVMTMRKLKTSLLSLKAPIPKILSSNVIYQINCSRCDSCYVGITTRHVITRCLEHRSKTESIKSHLVNCNKELCKEPSIKILARSHRGVMHLLVLEALFIRELKPNLNIKDEWTSRSLRIRI